MSTNFYQRMAGLYERVTSIETRLNMPQRNRELLIRHSSLNQAKIQVFEDYLIDPTPYITSVSPKLIGMPFGNITVSENDFLVEIPRTKLENLFFQKETSKRVTFIIDPPLTEDRQVIYSNTVAKSIASGIKCTLLHLFDEDPLIWKLILTKNKD